MNTETTFHKQLKERMDHFVDNVYLVTRKFPREEIYGVTSQLRRAALSVVLNYIEGYARQRDAVLKNFLEISYGSLKESLYLIEFSHRQQYMNDSEYKKLSEEGDKVAAMLYGILKKMQ